MSDLRSLFGGSGVLRGLPTSLRVVLTLFLLMVAGGYLAALGNLYYRFEMADMHAGLSTDDITAHFHGLEAPTDPVPTAAPTRPFAARSRMLEMVEPGGEMYKHLSKGGEPAIRSLIDWLKAGAPRTTFATGTSDPPDPQTVIRKYCLRCHNAEDGEKQDTPYGPDVFTADYDLVYVYAAPGTAEVDQTEAAASNPAGATQRRAAARAGVEVIEPQSLAQLFLVTHIHMLSMPVFTLIVGGLFLFSDWPRSTRGLVAVAPMAAMAVDFASWWLARQVAVFVEVTIVMGVVFGAALAVQLAAVAWSLWFGRTPPTSA